MTFVYPLLLGGLLLAGLPVLLHFLVRQKPKTLLFPAFRFLMQKRRSNTRNLRLRHLLLLLLRIALLALLCLALARPRLFHAQRGMSREKPVAVVLIFDTSPSMDYKQGDQTRLDLAKRRGLELLEQLPDDCRVLILDSSDGSGWSRADWLRSLEKARQRIQGLTTRPENTAVTRAVQEAQRRFDEWDRSADDPEGQNLPRLVCVFSDRTKASWESSASAKRGTGEEVVKVKMLLFDVGIDDPLDLAITHLELPPHHLGGMRQSFGAGEKINLSAAVTATGKGAEPTIICPIAKPPNRLVPLDAGEQRPATFEIDTEGWTPGLYQTEVKVETEVDQLPFNNRRFVTFEVGKMPAILVLVEDVKKADVFKRALEACRYKVDLRSVHEKKQPVLADYAAVFLDGLAAPTDDLWKSLMEYSGGIGIIPGGEEMKASAYNSEIAQKVMPATIKAKRSVPAPRDGQWNLAQLDLDRPFFRPFQAWFLTDNPLTTNPASVTHFWDVEPNGKDSAVLAHYYEGTRPAVVEKSIPGGGRILLLTTPMEDQIPAWNDYQQRIHFFYVALTTLCARHLCPEPANPQLNFVFGKEPPPTVREKRKFAKYLLTGPGVSEEIRFDGHGLWVGDRLPRAGNYAIAGLNEQEQVAMFSINIAREESDLSRVPISAIEAIFGKDAVVPQDRKTSLPATLNWDEPVELFPWLMLLVLFFLALENLLANKFYRQEPIV